MPGAPSRPSKEVPRLSRREEEEPSETEQSARRLALASEAADRAKAIAHALRRAAEQR